MVYVEWEGDVRPIAEENLSPEFEAERKRLADAGHRVWPLGWPISKSIPQLLKYKDWLTLAPGFYHSMLIKKEDSWSLITAYLFSHCAYEAPPYLHKWQIAFENNPPPQITLENLFIRDLDLRRVNSQFTQDEEGKEVRIWRSPSMSIWRSLKAFLKNLNSLNCLNPNLFSTFMSISKKSTSVLNLYRLKLSH